MPIPQITIVTPTHNRRDLLAGAIRSVQVQSFQDYEHIIVDDGSSDHTDEMVDQIADPRIRYFRSHKRVGANAARNLGWQSARSSLITFLDSDDQFMPHRLRDMVARFSGPAAEDLTISSFTTVKSGRSKTNANPPRRLNGQELRTAVAGQLFYMATSAITVRRDLLFESNGFDETLPRFQDGDLLLRLGKRWGALLLPGVDWIKNDTPGSITRAEQAVAAYAALSLADNSYAEDFPEMLRYMVSRAIVSSATKLHLNTAWNSFRVSRKPPLSFSTRDLLMGYVEGKRLRRKMHSALWYNTLPAR